MNIGMDIQDCHLSAGMDVQDYDVSAGMDVQDCDLSGGMEVQDCTGSCEGAIHEISCVSRASMQLRTGLDKSHE